jgi:hypothetical protein
VARSPARSLSQFQASPRLPAYGLSDGERRRWFLFWRSGRHQVFPMRKHRASTRFSSERRPCQQYSTGCSAQIRRVRDDHPTRSGGRCGGRTLVHPASPWLNLLGCGAIGAGRRRGGARVETGWTEDILSRARWQDRGTNRGTRTRNGSGRTVILGTACPGGRTSRAEEARVARVSPSWTGSFNPQPPGFDPPPGHSRGSVVCSPP